MTRALLALILAVMLPASAFARPEVAVWRLDCGRFDNAGLNGNRPVTLSAGCYLVRHGDDYLLWDAGLARSFIGKPEVTERRTISLDRSIVGQLQAAHIRPEQITIVALSHGHFDHIGQAADFPAARLLIGDADYRAVVADPARAPLIAPWLKDGAKFGRIAGDHDVFGDGSIEMVSLPGHTAGHYGLLVRRSRGTPVLLSGDLYNLTSQLRSGEVGRNVVDTATARASMQRFVSIAAENHAVVVIQHDPLDIAKLPELAGRKH